MRIGKNTTFAASGGRRFSGLCPALSDGCRLLRIDYEPAAFFAEYGMGHMYPVSGGNAKVVIGSSDLQLLSLRGPRQLFLNDYPSCRFRGYVSFPNRD